MDTAQGARDDACGLRLPSKDEIDADLVTQPRGKENFSEAHGSKQPLRRSAKHSTTAWWHPFGVETLRLGSSSCTYVYQGVATRNDAITREILVHRTGSQANFLELRYGEVR